MAKRQTDMLKINIEYNILVETTKALTPTSNPNSVLVYLKMSCPHGSEKPLDIKTNP
jgi:hypothetical protein